MRPLLFAAVLLAPLAACGTDRDEAATSPPRPVAVIQTSMGDVTVELFSDEAPRTVANFLDLAEGRKEFTDPATGEKATRPFYDGLVFHRVIAGFMIQGGCPQGTGSGGPGYQFEDEINARHLGLHEVRAVEEGTPHPWLLVRTQDDFERTVLLPLLRTMGMRSQEELSARQDEVQAAIRRLTLEDVYENLGYRYDESRPSHAPLRGTLAMANSGPATNGSQFFIGVKDNSYLSGKHTVFGQVVEGMDVVDAISEVETGERARPKEDVKIVSIRERR